MIKAKQAIESVPNDPDKAKPNQPIPVGIMPNPNLSKTLALINTKIASMRRCIGKTAPSNIGIILAAMPMIIMVTNPKPKTWRVGAAKVAKVKGPGKILTSVFHS